MRFEWSVFLGAGLILMMLAFILSFTATFTPIGDWGWLVDVLGQGHQSSARYVHDAVLLGALPVSVLLAFFVVGFALTKESVSGAIVSWGTLVLGGLTSFFGYLFATSAYNTYSQSVRTAHLLGYVDVDDSFLAIYVACGLIGVLWLATGVFLWAVGGYKIRQSKVLT
jgi:hypothetical protein